MERHVDAPHGTYDERILDVAGEVVLAVWIASKLLRACFTVCALTTPFGPISLGKSPEAEGLRCDSCLAHTRTRTVGISTSRHPGS
jgi:hypothetical protein